MFSSEDLVIMCKLNIYEIIVKSNLELFAKLEKKLDIKMNYTQSDWRESEQKVFVADIEKAKRIIGWTPKVSADDGISRMLNWLIK